MSEFGSTRKRRLIDSSSLSFASPASSVKSLKSAADIDELKLVNEQLQDELRGAQDELGRVKEKHARQIEFLEQENEEMKKAASKEKERYYDEKKKWQAKYREASKNASNTSISFSTTPASMKKNTRASTIALDDTEGGEWTARLEALEKDVKDRAEQAHSLAKENAELRKTVADLERASPKGNNGSDEETTTEYRSEARELRKKVGDLEISLRRKSRDLERLQAKMQNQSVLEEELSAANNKNMTMTSAVESAKSIEADYRAMLEERKTWSVVLKDTLRGIKSQSGKSGTGSKGSKAGAGGGQVDFAEDFESLLVEHTNSSGDVSPMALLKAFSAAQRKVALLLKEKGDHSSQMTLMKQQLARAKDAAKKEKGARSAEGKVAEEAICKASSAKKQVNLYEAEVKSLRGLLKSFDSEFGMGKRPSKEDFLQAKNDVIEQLRAEVDQLRARAAAVAEREAGMTVDSPPSSSSLSLARGEASEKSKGAGESSAEQQQLGMEREVDGLQAQIARLSEELRGIKAASGLDYVPGRTKVLHLKENPVLQAATVKGPGAVEAYHQRRTVSSLPQEALKIALAMARDAQAASEATCEARKGLDKGTDKDKGDSPSTKQTGEAPAPAASAIPLAVDSAKLNLRLKEMFKERITTFREAVYLLTGWKIDMIFESASKEGGGTVKPQLRLRSMYAETPEDSLLFQWTEENKLNLMGTLFAQKMNPTLLQSLQTLNSVPIFLGAVTSELFEMQTVM